MNTYTAIISQLYFEASKSVIEHQLAAGIIKSNKLISKPHCNSPYNVIKGYGGSLHAEAHAIIKYFGKSSYLDKNKDSIPYSKKRRKLDLIVIRINKTGEICNARPCCNCLHLMKSAGIHKVYYSISATEIICENIKDMVSIQTSSVTRYLDLNCVSYKDITCIDILLYYEKLLQKYFPPYIKKINLDHFIQYNLNILLPSYKTKIFYQNNKQYICIINMDNLKIIEAEII
jgi:deoxycytidylate deaminase